MSHVLTEQLRTGGPHPPGRQQHAPSLPTLHRSGLGRGPQQAKLAARASAGKSDNYAGYPKILGANEEAPSRAAGLTGALNREQEEPVYYQEEPSGPLEAVMESRWGRGLVMGTAVFLASTLAIAIFRTGSRNFTPQARSKRNINKNRVVVDTLSGYLPEKREQLTQGVIVRLKLQTGFSPTEIFRKYLWFLLRERKFDDAAIQDLVALKWTAQLSDSQVADALRERAQRIYERYGNVMMDVAGMTQAGIERKATCRALFSKLLYLAESEQLLDQESSAAKGLDISTIFGAMPNEADQLRIVSLQEVDMDKLESQFIPGQPPPAV